MEALKPALIPGLPDEIAEECLIRVAYDHLSILHSVCRRWREQVLSPSFHHRRRLAGVTRRLFVVIQKLIQLFTNDPEYTLTLFDPILGTWRSLFSIPALPNVENIQILGVGRLLLAIGRYGPSSVSIYDCLTGTWREGAPMPRKKKLGFTCVSDGVKQVYAVGGYGAQLAYDVEENRWETLPYIPTANHHIKGDYHAGKLYLTREDHRIFYSKYFMDVYDISSREWSVAEIIDGVKFDTSEQCAFTITPDGKMYSCWKGFKIRVKDDGKWQDFVDLPDELREYNLSHLSSWEGGLLIIGGIFVGAYKVYTLTLGKQNPYLSWITHVIPTKGTVENVIWLEI